jgi:hypothetical protein
VIKPRSSSTLLDFDDLLLDQEFDDIDEVLIYEPPIRCVRGGRVTLVEKDPDDDGTDI